MMTYGRVQITSPPRGSCQTDIDSSLKMTLSNAYLNANLDILDQLGFPRASALETLKMSESSLRPAQGRVDLDSFLSCLRAAANATSNPLIGLQLGLKFRVGTFGNTGAIYGYCENLEEVMAMNNLYQKIAIDAGQVQYLKDMAGGHHMCFIPYYEDLEQYRLITDMIMASYVTTYRWLSWGSGEDIICVKLPYVQDKDKAEYGSLLKTRVGLNSEHICMEFSDIAMSQKLTTRNPELLARARLTLNHLSDTPTDIMDFEKGLEAAIRGAIHAGCVSAQTVADRMGLSFSAFRSHLKKTGEGVRPRVDRVRKSLFFEKHAAGLSLAQIALDLAYNDQASMNRAFRRWFGMTPTEWIAEKTDREDPA